MRPDRCGNNVPLDRMLPGDRKAVEDFRRYLQGELALAADGYTYVSVDSPDAVHFAGRPDDPEEALDDH